MKKTIYVILQCTWGAAQTLLGFVVFLFNLKRPHQWYRECIDTRWKLNKGLSLGLFIFTPETTRRTSQMIRVHEYGHTIQSLMLGPLYMLVVLVSALWAGMPCFVRIRRRKGLPYTAFFVEAWASKLGEKITGRRAI